MDNESQGKISTSARQLEWVAIDSAVIHEATKPAKIDTVLKLLFNACKGSCLVAFNLQSVIGFHIADVLQLPRSVRLCVCRRGWDRTVEWGACGGREGEREGHERERHRSVCACEEGHLGYLTWNADLTEGSYLT